MEIVDSIFVYENVKSEKKLKDYYLLSMFEEVKFSFNNNLSINDIIKYENIFINGSPYNFDIFKMEELKGMGIYVDNNNVSYKDTELKYRYVELIYKLLNELNNIIVYSLQVK